MELILIYRELQEENAGLLAQRIVPSAQGVVCMVDSAASTDHVNDQADSQDEKLRWRWNSVKISTTTKKKSTFQSTFQLKVAS